MARVGEISIQGGGGGGGHLLDELSLQRGSPVEEAQFFHVAERDTVRLYAHVTSRHNTVTRPVCFLPVDPRSPKRNVKKT